MRKLLLSALATTLLLAGCDETTEPPAAEPPSATAAGLWNGAFRLDSDAPADTRKFHALVNSDGDFHLIYTGVGGTGLAGLAQGSGSSSSGTLTYTARVTVRDAAGSRSGALAGSYVVASRFKATVVTSTDDLFINPDNSVNYDPRYGRGPATLPNGVVTLNGTALTAGGTGAATVTLNKAAADPTLVVSGQIDPAAASPCDFFGPVAAANAGNYFELALSFAATPACSTRGLSGIVPGVVFVNDAGKLVLMVAGARLAFLEG
jgi:hypothetical protein